MNSKRLLAVLVQVFALLLFVASALAQETTGGLQGTVKDPSGAVIAGASVTVTGTTLVGSKTLTTDGSGYYRFANLPPGIYAITVTAKGFQTTKREGLALEVGHLPTVDFTLKVGAETTVVEVTGAAPVIDVTRTQNISNVTSDVIADVPHGITYQSVIQFAPMARNEPLGGLILNGGTYGGTGGSLPGSSGNGNAFGYSVGGAADSENGYLVEGQDTEHISGGYSKANVPFQFVQEVQLKTSGIEAEYGGALGGVVNVIMKKGGNAWHGGFFTTYEANGLDGDNNNIYLRDDPLSTGNYAARLDPTTQLYNPSKDHFKIVQPGFTIGGPILKDRLWFFAGFAPLFNSLAKTVNFGTQQIAGASYLGAGSGTQYFTQDTQTYYTTARLDASLTSKIRVFASWLDQYARQTGVMPISNPIASESGYQDTSIYCPLTCYSHGLGWAAPNSTYNFGADITLTPKIVSTTRFGYFFENYHDFGWQTTTPALEWLVSAVGGLDNQVPAQPLPANLALPSPAYSAPYDIGDTQYNANKHYQFNQDVAFFKSGWWGTHNIKVGYQLNHLFNTISQAGNVPYAYIVAGQGISYAPSTTTGAANCAILEAEWGVCAGQYGYLVVSDFGTKLPEGASDWNHALFIQDAWTVGHGLTLTLGLRVEKESLPAPGGVPVPAINFGWTEKIAPRLGAAWDPTGHGKMKIFGSYGVVNDVMKLLLAQTSWGAQYWNECVYALGPDGTPAGFSTSDINLTYVNGRACPSGTNTQPANFVNGVTPASLMDPSGVSLIENVNFRPAEPVAPGVLPYRQHEFVAGWDYQLKRNLAFEARYDRRRLDHIIEDASLADPTWFEMYAVVNPGQGVNSTLDGYASYLQSLGQAFLIKTSPPYEFNGSGTFGTCPTCPPNPQAIRNYDGVEIRLTKTPSKNWSGMFSYTYSRLWGNYTGLTTTDQIDGNAAGRNSPDTTRAFDEPFYYFGANGQSTDGFLPTDRPNVFKGYAYYTLPWKGMSTTFGIFQYAYQGTPVSSYVDLGLATIGQPLEATYIYGRGYWAPMTVNPNTGEITLGAPYFRRSPWFTQTDFSLGHSFKVKERQSLRFEGNLTNLFNQHAVLQYYQGMNSTYFATPLDPQNANLFSGAAAYNILEHGYNVQQWINTPTLFAPSAVIASTRYGLPQQYQLTRNFRLGVSYTF